MAIDVKIKEIKPHKGAVLEVTLPYSDIKEVMAKGFGQLMEVVQKQGATPTGPPFAKYLDISDENAWQVVLGIPVDKNIEADGDVKSEELLGGKVAIATHVGPYENLKQTWDAFNEWMESSEHTANGAPWESYVTDPTADSNPAEWRTDIYWPIS